MKYVLSSKQMKQVDDHSIHYIGIPSVVLMERAALAVADEFLNMKKGSVLVVSGSGNNGADGLAVARILYQRGFDVDILLVSDKEGTKEYAIQKSIIENMGMSLVNKVADATYDYIVDAIFGIGLSREITGYYKEVINVINHIHSYKIAVDIPSGINASTGEVMGVAVKVDKTVTFGYNKIGMLCGKGKNYCGTIVVKDIGFICDNMRLDIDTFSIDRNDICQLPKHKSDYDKGKCGKTLIIAGSKDMCGAACLSAKAAFRSGCGLVRVFTHADNKIPLIVKVPEVISDIYNDYTDKDAIHLKELIEWADCIVIGPGLSTQESSVRIVNDVIYFMAKATWNIPKTFVFDADALNIIAAQNPQLTSKSFEIQPLNPSLNDQQPVNLSLVQQLEYIKQQNKAHIIITPHIGEASRLLKKDILQVKEHPIESAKKLYAMMCNACVLKDYATVTTGNDGTYINTSGNCGMATAGSGDVLTGVIAGIVCLYKYEAASPEWIAAMAVYIHGCAGDICKGEKGVNGTMAWDIAEAIAKLL